VILDVEEANLGGVAADLAGDGPGGAGGALDEGPEVDERYLAEGGEVRGVRPA